MAMTDGYEFLAIVKSEETEDDDCIALTPPIDSVPNPKAQRYFDQLSKNGIGIGSAATHVPAILQEFYRQSSLVFKIDYTCALCSKSLKCRSARDMRDHALNHGGDHWASAFRCLLCSYHSHSRRSVSKHVTTVHLIPDGVQCAPGELMENETVARADELLALVRDCFPLPANGIPDHKTNNQGMDDGFALPVETTPTTQDIASQADLAYNSSVFGVVEVESDECESEGWKNEMMEQGTSSSKEAAIVDGWTVVEDGAIIDMGSEYDVQDPEMVKINRQISVQEAINQKLNPFFPKYPSMVENSASCSRQANAVLEGLLRDFQFQPNSYAVDNRPPVPRVVFRAPPPPEEEPADDPRALIERLLDVVAPDVARFLLEEAIRARAKAASTSSSVPKIEKVTGSVSMVGPAVKIPVDVKKTVGSSSLRLVASVAPKSGRNLATVVDQMRSRLGKLGTFKCLECQSVFKRRRYLERHIRSRHRNHSYRCTMPGCQFMNARELWYVRRHHAKHHSNETDLVCRICSQPFPNADEMTNRHHSCCSVIPSKSGESYDERSHAKTGSA